MVPRTASLLSTNIIRARAALNAHIWAGPARRLLCEAEVALGDALAAERACDLAEVERLLLAAQGRVGRALCPDHDVAHLIRVAYAELVDMVENRRFVFGEGDDRVVVVVESWAAQA